MAVSVAPSVEAMQAIVARINGAATYCLPVSATYGEHLIDDLEESETRVDVISETEEQLEETLDIEDRSSHALRIWIRKKVDSSNNDEINPLKLLTRQLFQRVNDYDTTNGRVKVWECDQESKESPDKGMLRQTGLFVTSILLRVEVEAS